MISILFTQGLPTVSVLADNYRTGLLTPEITVFTHRISYLPCNKTHLMYKNYFANYRNFPGASIKFLEISRSRRHPVLPSAWQMVSVMPRHMMPVVQWLSQNWCQIVPSTTIVHNHKHTQMSSSYRCIGIWAGVRRLQACPESDKAIIFGQTLNFSGRSQKWTKYFWG